MRNEYIEGIEFDPPTGHTSNTGEISSFQQSLGFSLLILCLEFYPRMQVPFAFPKYTIKNSKGLVQLDVIKNWGIRKLNLDKREGRKYGQKEGRRESAEI